MSDEARLRSSLDAVGLHYVVHQNDVGRLYAGFRLEAEPGVLLPYTATLRGNVLRFNARGVKELSDINLASLNERTLDWGLGALYQDPATAEVDASSGLYVGNFEPGRYEVFRTLEALRLEVVKLRTGAEIAWNAAPNHDQADVLAMVDSALTTAGVSFRQAGNDAMLVQKFVLEDRLEYYVEVFVLEARLLFMRARFPQARTLGELQPALHHLQACNAKAPIGAAVLLYEPLRVCYLLGFSLDCTRIDAALFTWGFDVIAAMMTAIDQALFATNAGRGPTS